LKDGLDFRSRSEGLHEREVGVEGQLGGRDEIILAGREATAVECFI
jgi:hypothetical protein